MQRALGTGIALGVAVAALAAHDGATRAAPLAQASCPDTGLTTRLAVLPARRGQPLTSVADSALYERNGIEQLFWRGDLNGDRRDDFISDYGYIGSQPVDFAVFVACGGGTYRKVFHAFASHISVMETGRAGWKDLRVDYEAFGSDSVDVDFNRWTGRGYEVSCAARFEIFAAGAVRRCPCCR